MRAIFRVENLNDCLLRERRIANRPVAPMLGDLALHFVGALAVILRQRAVPLVRRRQQLFQEPGQFLPGRLLPDTEARAIVKRPGAATFLQFGPDFPDAEIAAANIHVVQKNDSTRPDLWQPGVDIVTDCGLSMKAVDVEKVDALGLKFFARGVEAGTDQGGERFVIGSIVGETCANVVSS